MGKATTTQAINVSQLSPMFPGCAVFVYGTHAADGSEKTVEIRERSDRQIQTALDGYLYNPDFGVSTEQLRRRELAAKTSLTAEEQAEAVTLLLRGT